MKKLSFIFAMVFAASMAMAQTAVVTQTSNVANPQGQQIATVSQTGLSIVNINQNSDKVTPGLVAPIERGFDHAATATQSGGNDNYIGVVQIAEGNVYSPSKLPLEMNVTKATQTGSVNKMYQTQISGDWTSGGMVFTSNQIGENNTGTQYGKKTSSTFDLLQNGTWNTSVQQTTGEQTGVLYGDVLQVGGSNNATQLFHGVNVQGSIGAKIDQNGSSNVAVQEFSNAAALWGNSSSQAQIIQRQTTNFAYQSQIGEGSFQKTEQYGPDNDATMFSTGNFNNAYAYQDGTHGAIVITQKQTAGLAGTVDGNLAKIYQNGYNSEAYVVQDGWRNKVVGLNAEDYAINNNDSYLNVTQTGNDNLVRSSQVVNTAVEIVNQMGNGNTAIVNQY